MMTEFLFYNILGVMPFILATQIYRWPIYDYAIFAQPLDRKQASITAPQHITKNMMCTVCHWSQTVPQCSRL